MRSGKLTVQYPPEASDANGDFSPDRLFEYYNSCVDLVSASIKQQNFPVTKHRLLVLVDLQGVYLGFTRWLAEQNFPQDSGMVASRFAHYLLGSVINDVEARIVGTFEGGASFSDLVKAVFRKEIESIQPMSHVVDISASIELFYAPVPLARIEWQLQKRAREGSAEVRRQLADIREGRLKPHGDERDYAHYDHFIECIKNSAAVSAWTEGFFNFYVGPSGLKSFDEKEVDVRLVIRAVDACVDYEADSICIVSSDQDFVPLHERCQKSDVRSYQADVSKFAAQQDVGRRIKQLGDRFIPVGVDALWPMRAVVEACGHDLFNGVPVDRNIGKGISAREFSALCALHNSMNADYALEALTTSDGDFSVGVIDHRPLPEGP